MVHSAQLYGAQSRIEHMTVLCTELFGAQNWETINFDKL